MLYSLQDFPKTKSQLEPVVPETLIHRDVRKQFHESFSEERGHGVAVVRVPSKVLSLTIGHLNPGQQTRLHRHNYETILYVVKGSGYSLVEGQKIKWQVGDAVYVPVWAWHKHVNTGSDEAEYVACENAPHLQNLGIALREESLKQNEMEEKCQHT